MSASSSGKLTELGVIDAGKAKALDELQVRIKADRLETVRFVFVDQHGVLRGKAVAARAVASALRNGITVPSSLHLKEPSGKTAFPVWQVDAGFGPGIMTGARDMLLVPDPTAYYPLPWSPHSAWILCDVVQSDGLEIPFASRTVLSNSEKKLTEKGMSLLVGLEVEFHVFALVDETQSHETGGMPGTPPDTMPLNQGYQLLSDTAYSKTEPLLDDLRRTAEALGLPVRSVEIEFGPSQFEFTFEPGSALQQAECMVLFRSMVKQLCARKGLHATFMARPDLPNCAASGWHIHQSLQDAKSNRNLFIPVNGALSKQASGWIGGLLGHAEESCIFTTPTVNGYNRYGPGQLAPDRIQWGEDNRGAMIRGLFYPDDSASRIENRVAEPGANPYYALSAQILSGLSGMEQKLEAPAAVEMPYDGSAQKLPLNLGHAIEAFNNGNLYESALGLAFCSFISSLKGAEWKSFNEGADDWAQKEYFQFL